MNRSPGRLLASWTNLDEAFLSGQGFFLLDGLDEIGTKETRKALRSAIFAGIKRYPRCRWLLTSRLVGYDDVPYRLVEEIERDAYAWRHLIATSVFKTQFLDDQPKLAGHNESVMIHWRGHGINDKARLAYFEEPMTFHYVSYGSSDKARLAYFEEPITVNFVAPFTDEQIARFANNWYALREPSSERRSLSANRLLTAISGNADTLRLARVPNLLTLMALIFRVLARLPNGRAGTVRQDR